MRIKFIIFILLIITSVYAEKTDIVILKNGDKLTGEVKRLQFALLTFKTDAMSTVDIHWEDIYYIRSKFSFRVERDNGISSFGTIDTDTLNNELIVGVPPNPDKIKLARVVLLIPVKKTFLDALSINSDIGFSYTQASNILQLNFGGKATHTSRKYQRLLSFSSIVTAQKDTINSQNHDYKFRVIRFLTRKYFLYGGTGAQKNTELGLDLRVFLSGAGGKDFIKTNSNILNSALGLQITREWSEGTIGAKNNIEGIIAAQYSKFRLTTPKLNWNTYMTIYPNLTTTGRIRIEFNMDLKWEIVKNLYWKLSFFDKFDNKPESNTTNNNDYGITISLGWSHN